MCKICERGPCWTSKNEVIDLTAKTEALQIVGWRCWFGGTFGDEKRHSFSDNDEASEPVYKHNHAVRA